MSKANPVALVKRGLTALLGAFGLNTPTRIVIAISPGLTLAAGWVVSLAARYLPGLPGLDSAQVTAIFIAGATLMAGKLILWLYGAQKLDLAKATPTLEPTLGQMIQPTEFTHHHVHETPVPRKVYDQEAEPEIPAPPTPEPPSVDADPAPANRL